MLTKMLFCRDIKQLFMKCTVQVNNILIERKNVPFNLLILWRKRESRKLIVKESEPASNKKLSKNNEWGNMKVL